MHLPFLRSRRLLLACAAACAVASAGCDELDVNGSLDQGEFEYICGSPGDAACDGTSAIFGFDLDRDILPVAVGSSFGLTFDADDSAVIAPAAPSLVSGDGVTFQFGSASTVDFLALTPEGTLIDFAALSSQVAGRVAIFEDGDEVQAFSARRVDDVEVAAAPMNGTTVLGGAHSYSWSLTGTGVTLSGEADSDNVVMIRVTDMNALATLSVTSGEFSASVSITADN